jgi:cellulose biosynthesis protein BcsQ
MNVITLASRKGGVGKSTLTAHLAGFAHLLGYRSMVVDADPQGSLTLWHSMRANHMRGEDGLALQNAAQGVNRILGSAQLTGCQWVFIDTAPTTWLVVQEAIRAATLVLIPVRPGFFDLAAVRETVATARELGKPYAVVINASGRTRKRRPWRSRAPSSMRSRSRYGRARSASARAFWFHSPPAPVPAKSTAIPPAKPRSHGCGRPSSARSRRSTSPLRAPAAIARRNLARRGRPRS